MIVLILLFVVTVVSAVGQGITTAPGLASPPVLPQAALDHAKALAALLEAGRPAVIPANEAAPTDVTDEVVDLTVGGPPSNVPVGSDAAPVDVSGAPAVIDLTGVPAAEPAQAHMPDTVGAGEHADLPPQAGGGAGGPPAEVPPTDVPPVAVPAAEQAAPVADCAANAHGPAAAECHTAP